MRFFAVFILLSLLSSCGTDLPPNARRIVLDQEIHAPGKYYKQRYYGVADTLAWEEVLAAADTTMRMEGGFVKLRSKRIWYEFHEDPLGVVKARQEYPGWKAGIDSVNLGNNLAYLGHWNQMTAEVSAADILLGQDSVRIGVVRITGKVFPWQDFAVDGADYLLLYPPGKDSLLVALTAQNVGPITRQTIFRVGRQHYAVKSLSNDRRELVIETVPDPGDLPLVAEIDFNYRRVAVDDAEGNLSYVKREEGKELILLFNTPWSLNAGRTIGEVDSAYFAMPPERQANYQVEVIMQQTDFLPNYQVEAIAQQTNFLANYRDRMGMWSVRLPTHTGNEKTCLGLNCRSDYPYYVGVDRNGRITTFYGNAEELLEKFR
ncbi:hypothetical protein [Neolewinella antarctica]|uniref:Uncharacterized protein n=1 Tax=Neolewinella antarctica TaxID=442734 RepID=A0ABX0XFR9_9BACT|nr:hypothetical protein [Neolewinella antarctica]NJC28155.1 hypothetical protein [Neolewinella antarctica]